LKSINLDNFVDEMPKLGWKLDAIYPDKESRDGSSILALLYESDTWSIWSMFSISDKDLDNYQVDVSAGVFYEDYNDIVREILNVENQYFRAKDERWVLHGVVDSKVFIPNLSELIVEWAHSIDIALWLQHKTDAEGIRFDERVYACAWYGYTKYIEKQITELNEQKKEKYGVLTIDMLKKALEISQSRSKK